MGTPRIKKAWGSLISYPEVATQLLRNYSDSDGDLGENPDFEGGQERHKTSSNQIFTDFFLLSYFAVYHWIILNVTRLLFSSLIKKLHNKERTRNLDRVLIEHEHVTIPIVIAMSMT